MGWVKHTAIALESRLRDCRNVLTLGVKANFSEYSREEQTLIRECPRIYYPTPFYAELFDVMGKPMFPSCQTYRFAQDKIRQTALFSIIGIPHPRTRVYYGKRQHRRITADFMFPFIAKIPRGSARGRGVFLIHNQMNLDQYLEQSRVAYIQEYLPIQKDIRVVVIGNRVVHAYWRIAPAGDFRTNVAVGGRVSLDAVPEAALELGLHAAGMCQWNDVGMDICCCHDTWYVLEANMKYGKEGFRQAGLNYTAMMEDMIGNGDI
ncbi:MAG: RimK family alpha-L-glutamate ligase [Desulfatirhabdiaceae bacterium]